ncbi:hypothetical protein [Paraburkholderia youngii]|uniref:Uncharacterized protein n=2 Tax=Paraburkholderia youngii TaxID=2782701 RepID=A0A7Y6K7B2_9BURK|nr:hypothetical protein [Paraburkholderia youngii]NUY05740.1 hypothetical protein [Paraburkholderia youngii]
MLIAIFLMFEQPAKIELHVAFLFCLESINLYATATKRLSVRLLNSKSRSIIIDLESLLPGEEGKAIS